MRTWLVWILTQWLRWLQWLLRGLHRRTDGPRWSHRTVVAVPRMVFAPPKPKWVKHEVIRLKALMPQAGCRTVAHHFNRRWRDQRQMTVSKTYVADLCRKHQYLIYEARRKLKHRVPWPIRRNRVWGCDLLTKTDQRGQPHVALAILDHASRACLQLQQLSDKSSWTLLQELVCAVKRYGRPRFLRTDNEAVLVSRVFRFGLWLLGIRQQRIDPGCPWQNGRVERFIGTVKRELQQAVVTSDKGFDTKLTSIRQWYNHDRPHDHLQGRTPGEVWARIDVFAAKPG
jgi:putative transposase